MARYDKAIVVADEFMRLYPAVAPGMAMRGAYQYMRGDFAAAAHALAYFRTMPDWPRDMLWLFLARARLGEDGTADLAAGAGQMTSHDWPYPAIELFLGRRTPAEMQAAADREAHACEGLIFVAQWYLLRGQDADAIAAYRRTLETCPREDLGEYGYAVTELVRLTP